MNQCISFPVSDFNKTKIQMLNWVNRFNIFCLLDNCRYDSGEPGFECLLAAGSKFNIELNAGNAYAELGEFATKYKNEWLFGHLAYDLKNETEKLISVHPDGIGFSDLHFFVPETVLELTETTLRIYTDGDATEIVSEIEGMPERNFVKVKPGIEINNRISRESYTGIINAIKEHILRGDCYVINFCQEFYAENAKLDPLNAYLRLSAHSPNPFSVFYKVRDKYCLCASPERYLKKEEGKIFSQPIKGTAKRNLLSSTDDSKLKADLLNNQKEMSENVMIVDLVRNDLSRICKPGTVRVAELFGLYSFPQVHQMISTVVGEPMPELTWVDCVQASFPMGSMTGAPKKKVMELIEQYEQTRRGLFSGAIGYIRPGRGLPDFDFNVVIRSILYNETTEYLSFQTGGGITFNSDPEKEYEECLLKAEAMVQVLKKN